MQPMEQCEDPQCLNKNLIFKVLYIKKVLFRGNENTVILPANISIPSPSEIPINPLPIIVDASRRSLLRMDIGAVFLIASFAICNLSAVTL